jgi:cytochrome c oxidase subunit 2
MVPGHPTAIYLQADRAGDYEGQCAEFCGHEHAKMRLLIVAEPEDKFNAWLGASRAPGHVPLTDSEKRGQQIFLTSTCNMCHAISGTPAGGRLGPNLTHFASRRNLAANSYPNTKGHLGGWILDPQSLKPGVLMPQHSFTGQDLQAILDYVESLR